MSIDAAVARIGTILAMESSLLAAPGSAPAASAAPAAGSVTSATTPATATGGFAAQLATAQTPSAASAPAAGYVNPLAGASVRPERIDQGVDYAGTGTLGAIGPGVVTNVVSTGSGWEGGGYVEYKLTAGPYAGRSVYYAEGVTPTVTVGQTLTAGQPVATLIPGGAHGIEIGFAAGHGQLSYASAYGGGGGGQMTAAGQAFSQLIAALGGPPGVSSGQAPVGHFP